MDFSLFYFASVENDASRDKYRLLIEGAKFADEHGFSAIWTPERHFQPFGGLFPNPSVVSAALAMVTKRIRLRSGSVVLPLHNPLRVAEEWSVVDNLSGGRVELSFASGWHPDDFVLAPESYAGRKAELFRRIEVFKRLWQGHSIAMPNGTGAETSVRIYPMPIQQDLPIWVTTVSDPQTYIQAGAIGAGLLTNLMGQTVEDVARNIALYRQSLADHGYDPQCGRVTVLLHTFVGPDLESVREKVRIPFTNYLRSSIELFKSLVRGAGLKRDLSKVSPSEMDDLLTLAFDRYFETSALMGTPETCATMINRLKAIGVTEVACLMDFGVDTDSVLESLPCLNQLKDRFSHREAARHPSLQELLVQHPISLMQYNPRIMQKLAENHEGLAALPSLRCLLMPGDAEAGATPLLSQLPAGTVVHHPAALGALEHESLQLRNECLHHLFEAHADQEPDAIAVVCGEQRLTYRELNRSANKLAHRLRKLGVGQEVLVGLCTERSPELVIGLLAILKAGGAYVPLDPTYPSERLAFMLADSRVPVLVTQQHLAAGLPEHDAVVLCLDAEWESINAEDDANPMTEVAPEHLAYVIYTSGSTGKPKGVLVTHANVVRLFTSTARWFQFGPRDVWTLFHSYAFDFSVWELWGALLNGGRLVVVPYMVSRSPEEFYQLLVREGVTVLNQTPSAFRQLIRAEESLGVSPALSLRLVIFGGEALDLQSLRPWFERRGDHSPQLVNMYGITETTVHVTYRPIRMADLKQAPGSVIGRPIPDLQLYLLDSHLQPVPPGVVGEIFVGGAGVARGYLNRPELTAERFIINPFDPESGARIYRSGDVARYLSNGDLVYLGRADQQVKIRGFRIELGEIEAALSNHPAIREAVVVAREEEPGEKRLAAYVVPSPGAAPTVSTLRSYLKGKLPDYMVPTAILMLDSLPLTANGKVDRQRLPAPDQAPQTPEAGAVLPRNQVEALLARVWAEVLRREQVGVEENFFEMGGDSILAIQIVSRAKREGLHLTPRQLFAYPTITALAAVAHAGAQSQAEQGIVTGPLPLTPIQQWFFEQELPDPNHWNQALMLTAHEHLDPSLLEESLRQLVQHHDALRLRFTQGNAGWEQSNADAEQAVSLCRIDLSMLPESEQDAAMETMAQRLQTGLNIAQGPLLQAALFNLGPSRQGRVLIVIHHLAVDGVSWRILLEDLQTAYRQLSGGQMIALPPKTTAFQQWARSLQDYVRSAELRAEREYWLTEPRQATYTIPLDFPGGPNTEESARTITLSLTPEETSLLLHKVPGVFHTQINEVLLAALATATAGWSGQQSLLINLEGHGREEILPGVDLTRTVGWFTSIFPVLLEVAPSCSPSEAVTAAKEQLRRIPNQGIGYGLLRYLSGLPEVAERLRTMPEAQVSFNYLGQLDQAMPKPALFSVSQERTGSIHSPSGMRRHLVDLEGYVAGDRLELVWTYSENIHRHERIEALALAYMEALRSMISHSASPGTESYTPSDFNRVKLTQNRLDKILDSVSRSKSAGRRAR